MDHLFGLLFFILIFFFMILFHELGHFLIAKANGVMVKEFNVGWGPVIYKKKVAETTYSVKAIPLGGSCVYTGNIVYTPGKEKEEEQLLDNPDGIFFQNAPIWTRISIIVAGPVFNIIVAFIALMIVSFVFPVSTTIIENNANQAIMAEVQQGDELVAVNGEKVMIDTELVFIETEDVMTLTFERDGQEYDIILNGSEYAEGVNNLSFLTTKLYGPKILSYSLHNVYYYGKVTLGAFFDMIRDGMDSQDFDSPIGLYDVTTAVFISASQESVGNVIRVMLMFFALVSVNICIVNLLPIPALDGGRLVFAFIELATGKKVPPEKEGIIHIAGIISVVVLALFAALGDLSSLATF